MSEYTREEILNMIEEVGGPQNLDLSGKDLSGIDLSKEAITKELEKYRKNNPGETPPWFSNRTGGIDLRGVIFENAKFLDAHLDVADLRMARLEGAFFWAAHLERSLLKWAHLRGASFVGAHLEGANLRNAHLEGTDLGDAHLQGADLRGAHLQAATLDGANLQKAQLLRSNLQEASLAGANLHEAMLSSANLQKAVLSGANLQKAILFEANLQEASVDCANLQQASLSRTNFQEALLAGANFHEATLFEANLQEARLFEARLEKVDLSPPTSLVRAYFYSAFLDQTRMTRGQLAGAIGEEVDMKYYSAKETYLLLKNNFNQIGRYDDASWAYRKERRMERMTHRAELAPKYYDYPKLPEPLPTGAKVVLHRLLLPFRKARFHLSHLIRYLFDTAQLALCDFGENPWLVLIWAGAALFAFGLVYMGFGGLGPAPGASSAIALGDHFVYSLFAFATMDHPRIVATTGLAQFLTAFEALVGIFLAAIFVFTLGNRISRS